MNTISTMKRNILTIFLGLFIIASSAVHTGCKGDKTNLTFVTGGTSGTYYPYGMALAEIFNSEISGLNVSVYATGASTENIILINERKADLAIVQNDILSYAFDGTRLFHDKPVKGLTTVATLYMEVVQIVVSPESGINSIKDMKGKRISVGDAGSGVEANAAQILATEKLTFKDLNTSNLSFKDSGTAFLDGKIDGFFVTSGIPNIAIEEILETKSLKILPINLQEMSHLLTDYSFYIPYAIKKDAYKGITTADIGTIAVKATLIVREDLDEKLVYNLTKTMFENRDKIAKSIEKGNELDIHEAVKGISSVPLHSGARKYYHEKGTFKL
ncbi:MAG: TAXI family TRAP transporter solute-binding subunit [Leptospirales bacterium]|nr:TAXI family TRAP transporter solute-binding subunit [Leptospirales bacterium]